MRPSIDLVLRLWYSEGAPGTFGLPNGWGLDLPLVVPCANASTLTTQGRTCVIEFDWTDETGYHSGLRYLNNHGIKFEQFVPPQRLPSGLLGEYAYKLKLCDGSCDYFDGAGRPTVRQDIYGNCVLCAYSSRPGDTPHSKELHISSITDFWGQTVQVDYQLGSELRITLPDGGAAVVIFSDAGAASIVDPVRRTTTFGYAQCGGRPPVLSTINNPSGLPSTFEYTRLDYFDAQGAGQHMHAVRRHVCRGLEGDVLKHTCYAYSSRSSGHPFTGAALGLRLLSTGGSLMDASECAATYTYGGPICSDAFDAHQVSGTMSPRRLSVRRGRSWPKASLGLIICICH